MGPSLVISVVRRSRSHLKKKLRYESVQLREYPRIRQNLPARQMVSVIHQFIHFFSISHVEMSRVIPALSAWRVDFEKSNGGSQGLFARNAHCPKTHVRRVVRCVNPKIREFLSSLYCIMAIKFARLPLSDLNTTRGINICVRSQKFSIILIRIIAITRAFIKLVFFAFPFLFPLD